MVRRDESWVSDELVLLLARLSSQQADGVLRIVEAELQGQGITSLLEGPDKICTAATYYGTTKRKGWRHRAAFNDALAQARSDYRAYLLEHGVREALTVLGTAAPEAAQALRQQVTGEQFALAALMGLLEHPEAGVRALAAAQLGEAGSGKAVEALQAAVAREKDEETRLEMVRALGRLAGWRDGDRRSAAVAVLDRADVKTAAKRAFQVDMDDIDAEIERELARLASRGEGEAAGTAEDQALSGE